MTTVELTTTTYLLPLSITPLLPPLPPYNSGIERALALRPWDQLKPTLPYLPGVIIGILQGIAPGGGGDWEEERGLNSLRRNDAAGASLALVRGLS